MMEELQDASYSDMEVSDDDKLWAALTWIPFFGVILAIFMLLVEPQRGRPFIRYHAVQSIGANIIISIVSLPFVWTGCLPGLFGLVTIIPAIKAYQGEWLELPWLTQFCKSQGWI
jgi:uncharacterized membrane protein